MNLSKTKKYSAKFLNLKKLLQRYHTATLPLCLTGCMGVYEGGFECPPGEGVKCKSISEVNQLVDQDLVSSSQGSNNGVQEHGISVEKDTVCGKDYGSSCPLTSEVWYSPWFDSDQREKRKTKVLDAQDSI
ncbi:MAG: hypothetical protein BGO67_10520 [Alphaproteobacteria bacterium 41-28]|nr:MAG: hypothetical protein BGO67_10520 [Alphaproteobacteria bacterium 41-28]